VNLPKEAYIKNVKQLIDHGNMALRQAAVDIVEHALTAADPYTAIEKLIHLEDERLSVGEVTFNLTNYERIFILGAGKASRRIAQALEDILGDRISGGLFVLKQGDRVDLKLTEVIYAAHPIPDQQSYQGAKALLEMAQSFSEKDLVIAGITGGSSALLALPADGISLEDLQKVNEILLLSGANIYQINAVRKHLSRIKGGLLAQEIMPATLINLTVSDAVGDALDYITGPTVADTSTFDDARDVLNMHNLWDKFPSSVSEYLKKGEKNQETPKSFEGMPLHSFIVVGPARLRPDGHGQDGSLCPAAPATAYRQLPPTEERNAACPYSRPHTRTGGTDRGEHSDLWTKATTHPYSGFRRSQPGPSG